MNLPLGYKYSSVYAGIRKARKDDLALIVSDEPAHAAGVFTKNLVAAAPVTICRKHLASSRRVVKAILVNAGNANCATRTGDAVARNSCAAAAKLLNVQTKKILPASTGVIGVELDERLITHALPGLVQGLRADRFEDVANAITTTDLVMKTASRELNLSRGAIRIAGMTKGSGMIQPNMATTLGFVMTDAVAHADWLSDMLDGGVNRSYNRISVDGDTSTNDTLILLANGASGVKPSKKDRDLMGEALAEVMEDLARQIARDGEGARKLVIIDVVGAATEEDAVQIARGIANSPLVKTAIAGSDPNWGRILSAAGNAGVAFNPGKVDIQIQGVPVCVGGLAAEFEEAELKERLNAPDCAIVFRIRGKGRASARFWTCDFTEKYIEINASYRT